MKRFRDIGKNGRPNLHIPNFILTVILLLAGTSISAQLSSGGTPLKSESLVEWFDLEEVNVRDLLLEDELIAGSGKKQNRIAKEIEVSINPYSHGRWEQAEDGTQIWRLGIRGTGAKALAPVFNRYILEEGVRLYLFTPSGEDLLGAYTSFNNKQSAMLPVSYLPGDEIILQMEISPTTAFYGELEVGSVRWAYLPVFDVKSAEDQYFGHSGDCNVDINCSLGDDWQIVKNSVVRLLTNEKCTGVLVNNTRNEDKAYILTAAHCVFSPPPIATYNEPVVYFQYESPSCDGLDGSTAKSIAGATLIATGDTLENPRDGDSLDFALLELSVMPPDSFNAFYAGWNRSSTPHVHTTTIHHPSGDVKKISVDYDTTGTELHDYEYFDSEGLIPSSFWRVYEWDIATTEWGSSGCPLFNQSKRIVGTLTGGQATCLFQKNDYFTRFDYAWDYYDEPSKQLKYWLDPDNTGVISLGGKKADPVSTGREIERETNINLYPNPASGFLTVESPDINRGAAEIRIHDVTGSLVMENRLEWAGRYTLDISKLPAGIYILHIRQGAQLEQSPFIISR